MSAIFLTEQAGKTDQDTLCLQALLQDPGARREWGTRLADRVEMDWGVGGSEADSGGVSLPVHEAVRRSKVAAVGVRVHVRRISRRAIHRPSAVDPLPPVKRGRCC